MDFKISGENKNAEISLNETQSGDVLYLKVDMTLPEEEIPEKFSVTWYFSAKDCASTWSPSLQEIHGLFFDWGKKRIKSRLASWMPLQQLISRMGKNKTSNNAKAKCSFSALGFVLFRDFLCSPILLLFNTR